MLPQNQKIDCFKRDLFKFKVLSSEKKLLEKHLFKGIMQ
jgi:hypothetical protein